MNIDYKAICFFIHGFCGNEYQTLLLDVKSLAGNSSEFIKSAFNEVADYFGLKKDCLMVGDNASVNTAAFKERKVMCFAHAIQTACRHLTTETEDSSCKIKYGIDYASRKKITTVFNIINQVCQIFRGSHYKELCQWYDQHRFNLKDLPDLKLRKPPKPCPTRWLERFFQLEWIREFGVLCFRFFVATGYKYVNLFNFHYVLIQLHEILFLLNVLYNSLELLSVEKQCSVHLVIPILHELKIFFTKDCKSLKHDIPKLMVTSFLHELNSGCLTIPDYMKVYYECGYVCCLENSLLDEENYISCLNKCESIYQTIYNACTEEEKSTCSTNGWSLFNLMTSKMSSIPNCIKSTKKQNLRNALFYREEGPSSFYPIGNINNNPEFDTMSSLILMDEKQIDKEIKKITKSLKTDCSKRVTAKRSNKDFSIVESEYKRLALLYDWKSCGAAEDDKMDIELKKKEEVEESNCIFNCTSKAKGISLYDGLEVEKYNGIENIPLKKFYEKSLSLAATEADCERFFRIVSLTAKRKYTTSMNDETCCSISYLRYYKDEVFYLFGNGKDEQIPFSKLISKKK